jgi:hypothetical protein
LGGAFLGSFEALDVDHLGNQDRGGGDADAP